MSAQADEVSRTTEHDAESSEPAELDRDDVFHVLQCRRRRLVLKYLKETDGPAEMSDVAEHIAALEHDTTVAALRSQERQRVYIALYQSHLPKMDKAGIIDYEQDRGIVERTELTETFDPYLAAEPSLLSRDGDVTDARAEEEAEPVVETRSGPREEQSPGDGFARELPTDWQSRYLYTSLVGLVLVGGSAAGVIPGSFTVGLALGVTLLFALIAVGHHLSESGRTEPVDSR